MKLTLKGKWLIVDFEGDCYPFLSRVNTSGLDNHEIVISGLTFSLEKLDEMIARLTAERLRIINEK